MSEVPSASCPWEVTVKQVQQMRADGVPFLLLDCRRADELQVARIEGAVWIPMDELPDRVAELGESRDLSVVVHCHHGGRSLMVARWLRQQGWQRAQSMAGGIDAWSQEIDPTVIRY